MKRILAVFLCLCLLIPAMGLSFGQTALAELPYEIAPLPLKVSGRFACGGLLFSFGNAFEPVDLTPYGVDVTGGEAIPAGRVGISMDVYISGDAAMVSKVCSGGCDGQIELSSGGACDVGERCGGPNLIKWQPDAWRRCVIDISQLGAHTDITGEKPFDSSAVNFFRVYMNSPAGLSGVAATMKIRNVKLVNLKATAPSLTEDPLGDGTFEPEAPVWKHYPVADGYCDDDIIVAGYNAVDYVKEHDIKVADWSAVINSLANGLATAGGGALFLPAGEYDCYSEIMLPTGVTIYGEWACPDDKEAPHGTVLKVHEDCGAGRTDSLAFITMMRDSMLKGLTFYYPGQKADAPVAYPPTVELGQYTHAKNITFVNSYWAVKQAQAANCPNVENIYGTPLYRGLDINMVVDIMRIENVNFAPDYWIDSGFEGAPAGEAADTLRSWILYNSTGIVVRRIDWSYLVNSTVRGYATGILFERSSEGNSPNGQCDEITLDGCRYGLVVSSVSDCGEMITNSHFINCENGIVLSEGNTSSAAVLQIINTEIEAENYALYNQQATTVMMMNSTIRSGQVGGCHGWSVFTNNVFETTAPQIVLENGSLNAVLIGNTDKDGKPVRVDNQGLCPVSFDEQKADVPEISAPAKEAVSFIPHKPANEKVYILDCDNDGSIDVTFDLQMQLNEAAKGGGVVYMPAGHYLINGSVTVPSGVELRGACDFGRVPYNIGTVIDVSDRCSGKPTIVLSEKSGIRGVLFNYPDQYQNDLFKTEKKFTAYPYAVQGRGADIYVINVGFHNAWDGLDMMTYRCDNHYVDYLCGICLHNAVCVGKGAENGIIRNYQFNYNTIVNSASYAWGSLPLSGGEFGTVMQTQLNADADVAVCLVGDVENELIYDCFNYSGYAGIRFIAEETGAADATVIGHGCDYSTIDIDVLAAERVSFLNTQLTAFNQIGDLLTDPMYVVHLGPDFEGQVDMTGTVMWANPTQEFRVENGTLNLYGVVMAPYSDTVQMTNVTGDGRVNMVNACFKAYSTHMASRGADKVYLNGATTYAPLYEAAQMPQYDNVQVRVNSWDAPLNANIPAAKSMCFTDAFTQRLSLAVTAGGDATVTTSAGMATLNMGTSTSVGMVKDGLKLTGGTADDLYYLETRIRADMFHQNGNVRVMLALFDNDSDPCYPVTFTEAGEVVLADGTVLAKYSTGAWYRLALEIDMRDADAKTYRVVLMDDGYGPLAQSDTIAFPEEFQGDRLYLKQVYFGAMADAPANAEEATDRTIVRSDYIFMTRGVAEAAGTPGDVNGDEKIDSTDARLILQYYAKKIGEGDLNTAVADVNGDGKADSTDARLILQLYAKKISNF